MLAPSFTGTAAEGDPEPELQFIRASAAAKPGLEGHVGGFALAVAELSRKEVEEGDPADSDHGIIYVDHGIRATHLLARAAELAGMPLTTLGGWGMTATFPHKAATRIEDGVAIAHVFGSEIQIYPPVAGQ